MVSMSTIKITLQCGFDIVTYELTMRKLLSLIK